MTTPRPLNASPLALEHHQFREIRVVASEDENPTGAISLMTSRQVVLNDTDPRLYLLKLTLEIGASNPAKSAPYQATIIVEGLFKVSDGYPEKCVENLVHVTGTSILYGACREMLANLTARGPHGLVSLPSVSFVESKPSARKASKKIAKKKTAKRAQGE